VDLDTDPEKDLEKVIPDPDPGSSGSEMKLM
jgi:hypothetical protein